MGIVPSGHIAGVHLDDHAVFQRVVVVAESFGKVRILNSRQISLADFDLSTDGRF